VGSRLVGRCCGSSRSFGFLVIVGTAGTVSVSSTIASVNSITFATGNYVLSGRSSPAATIGSLLKDSYHGGLWDQGQFRSSIAMPTIVTVGWIDDTADQKVIVTGAFCGDFNLDGHINGTDYDIWYTNADTPDATWQSGDANYDGAVNGTDYDLWWQDAGGSSGGGDIVAGLTAGVAVPEPGTLAMLAAGLIGLLACASIKRA